MLSGMRIMIGITGGIAAYKTPYLVRGLVKLGAEVRVVMSRNAEYFVAPLTLQTLSGNPVLTRMFETGMGPPMAHIDWTRDLDLMLVAPATANFLGKAAAGIADDLLTTVLLTVQAPLLVAPAMNSRMYQHPAVVHNLEVLRNRSTRILEPNFGELACGEEGPGRMAEVEEILEVVQDCLVPRGPLSGKRVLITAGPTVEPIDPVRYITNRSSGKMGYALAREAQRRGGRVTLVSGPTRLEPPKGITMVSVQTALEMRQEVLKHFPRSDLVVMAAAVGDYRAASPSSEKIKKDAEEISLCLVTNPDILKELAEQREKQVLVGFAAETSNLTENAQKKLQAKGVDLLVANQVSENGLGFGSDKNRVLLLYRGGGQEETGELSKEMIARRILDRVCERFFCQGS